MAERKQRSQGGADQRLPGRIFAVASPVSWGGQSMMAAGDIPSAQAVGAFTSPPEIVHQATVMLRAAGFEILHVSPLMITIAGAPATYERAFNCSLHTADLATRKMANQVEDVTVVHVKDDTAGLIPTAGTRFERLLDAVAIERPRFLMQPRAWPSSGPASTLRVPGELSAVLNADRAHRAGLTGANVRVAVLDSGFYRHPFFEQRGYRIAPVVLGPAADNPEHDEVGHGTGMIAIILAVAPDAEMIPVKVARAGRASLIGTLGAFNAALDLDPDIIACPWGSDLEDPPLAAADHAMVAAVSSAIAMGKVVVFASGNGHYGFPGQHPEIISAGGAFPSPDGSWESSSYASGFTSKVFANRQVPDVCGAVGAAPDAALIVVPTEPGALIEQERPTGEGASEGWCVIGGTSAAAAQIAGAAAVIRQAFPGINPLDVREALKQSARDVVKGKGHERFAEEAKPGPDVATGYGVIDIAAAAMLAAVWGISTEATFDQISAAGMGEMTGIPTFPPFRPPFPPFQPFRPVIPFQPPFRPLIPFQPPFRPLVPFQPPFRPLVPFQPPFRPLIPFQPFRPVIPFQPPFRPLVPFQPFRPLVPFQPPFRPLVPFQPFRPLVPFQPFRPLIPFQPFRPLVPFQPFRPLVPFQPFRPLVPFGPFFETGGQFDSMQRAAIGEQRLRAQAEQAQREWEAQQQASWEQQQMEAQRQWEAQQQAAWEQQQLEAQRQWEAQQQAAWEQQQLGAQQQWEAAQQQAAWEQMEAQRQWEAQQRAAWEQQQWEEQQRAAWEQQQWPPFEPPFGHGS